jgi:hypothetical protein
VSEKCTAPQAEWCRRAWRDSAWGHEVCRRGVCIGACFFHGVSVRLNHVVVVMPEAQRRFVPRMLIAQDAQRRRGQDKMARRPGGQGQPACGQDAQKVAVAEDQDVAFHSVIPENSNLLKSLTFSSVPLILEPRIAALDDAL